MRASNLGKRNGNSEIHKGTKEQVVRYGGRGHRRKGFMEP